MRSQIVTSRWGGTRKMPLAFTEQGVAMLSSVLKSKKAIQVNIQIMRTFTEVRKTLANYGGLRKKIEAMERKYDQQFKVVFDVIKKILEGEDKSSKKIGFTK